MQEKKKSFALFYYFFKDYTLKRKLIRIIVECVTQLIKYINKKGLQNCMIIALSMNLYTTGEFLLD